MNPSISLAAFWSLLTLRFQNKMERFLYEQGLGGESSEWLGYLLTLMLLQDYLSNPLATVGKRL